MKKDILRRRKIIRITNEALLELVKLLTDIETSLPKDTKCIRARDEFATDCWLVGIVSKKFGIVEEGREAPVHDIVIDGLRLNKILKKK